jgi:plastocyanin
MVIVAVVVIAAGAAGAYFVSQGNPSSSSSPELIDLHLVESNPVTQSDSFVPENITVTHGTTITLAIQNGDDEARTFEISAFNVNETIGSGATDRITFTVGSPGTYPIFVPPAPAYQGYRASPSVTGYIIVS